MILRAGVLIVGSLWWDDSTVRREWRSKRLSVRAAQLVRLPIRYGRRSSRRSNTFTMVLSPLCYRHRRGLGTGYIVPCRAPIASTEDLLREVKSLARAEGLSGTQWTWGAVGILVNPKCQLPDKILTIWGNYFQDVASRCQLFERHAASERPIVSSKGILSLRWPTLRRAKNNVDLDLLLATPTAPSLTKHRHLCYPQPGEIAAAYVRAGKPGYFGKNVGAGIRTAQDMTIWKAMLRMRPTWAAENPEIAGAIQKRML